MLPYTAKRTATSTAAQAISEPKATAILARLIGSIFQSRRVIRSMGITRSKEYAVSLLSTAAMKANTEKTYHCLRKNRSVRQLNNIASKSNRAAGQRTASKWIVETPNSSAAKRLLEALNPNWAASRLTRSAFSKWIAMLWTW